VSGTFGRIFASWTRSDETEKRERKAEKADRRGNFDASSFYAVTSLLLLSLVAVHALPCKCVYNVCMDSLPTIPSTRDTGMLAIR
jgi:hypothetical protein